MIYAFFQYLSLCMSLPFLCSLARYLTSLILVALKYILLLTLGSHVDNAVTLGDRWFYTLEYNTVITGCLNLVMFLEDSYQGISRQSHRTEQTKRPKVASENYQSFFIHYDSGQRRVAQVKNFPGYYRSLELLSILYFSHLSSNQVPDSFTFVYLCFHPYILRWLEKKKILFKNKNPQSDWNMSHSMSWGNQHFSCGENLSILMLRFQGASWPQFVNSAHTHKKICYWD